ncbi:FtsX-like permease family protein [Nocardioides zeae]|uniref:FtsX-like permease family protein n=1 Tax=Nocardioides imazamoxiresistens TaxID=3231893 RepID=A0ABU3PY94_9ACTN|nr:FtsX-like permease family protein [Nocardioides zeae]MDT9594200.1 FtsX-like permease family protein [Nocardioides zeae]
MLRAAWKSLLGRKVRLLMSTFAIVLGVAFVCGTLMFSDTLERSFTSLFSSTVGDVVVRPDAGTSFGAVEGSTRSVPAALVDELAAVDGAARADGGVTTAGVYVVDTDGKVVGGQGAPGLSLGFTTRPAAGGNDGLRLLDGRAPEGADEIALDGATAERAGYDLGDTVPLITPSAQGQLRAELVGLVGFGERASLNGATITVVDMGTAQQLFLDGEDAYTDIWVTAEPGVGQEELRDAVAPLLPDGAEAITGDDAADESASFLLEAISFLTTFLLIFAGIALVVGGFLIVNTFSMLVAQRTRELALLRALGASRGQVIRSVQLEALVVGLVGSTIGLGLGVLLAMGIRALFATFGLDLEGQPLVLEPRTVLAAYGVGIVVTMVAAWSPARRTSRIAPVQALRDDVALPETTIRRRMLLGVVLVALGAAAMVAGLFADVPRAGWWVGLGVLAVLLGVAAASPVLGRPLLLAAHALFRRAFAAVGNLAGLNALRNPRRTAATASALMIGLALASTMAILGDSAKASVDRTIEQTFPGDFVVSNQIGQGFSTAVADRMREVDGVERLVALRYGLVESGSRPQGLGGVDPADLAALDVVTVDGDLGDLRDGTVVVDDEYAEEQGLEVGDELTLSTLAGETDYPVVAVIEPDPVLGFPVVTTTATLLDAGYRDLDNTLVVDAAADAAGGLDGVEERLSAVVGDNPLVTVKDQAAYAAEQREPIDQLVLVIFALLGLALVIAVLGIVNTLALSVVERTREVGLLRAVGLGRGQLRWMVTLESVVIAALGAVLGLVMGVVFGVALMAALRDEGLEVISVPFGQLAGFGAASLVVGVLAAVLPARRAARMDVLTAVGSE